MALKSSLMPHRVISIRTSGGSFAGCVEIRSASGSSAWQEKQTAVRAKGYPDGGAKKPGPTRDQSEEIRLRRVPAVVGLGGGPWPMPRGPWYPWPTSRQVPLRVSHGRRLELPIAHLRQRRVHGRRSLRQHGRLRVRRAAGLERRRIPDIRAHEAGARNAAELAGDCYPIAPVLEPSEIVMKQRGGWIESLQSPPRTSLITETPSNYATNWIKNCFEIQRLWFEAI
jgi:hypothetical protein